MSSKINPNALNSSNIGDFEKHLEQKRMPLGENPEIAQASDRLDPENFQKNPRYRENTDELPNYVKSIRFLNPSDAEIFKLFTAIRKNTVLPKWASYLKKYLSIEKNILYLLIDDKKYQFWLKKKKRTEVKRAYFSPTQPIAADLIYQALSNRCCNITRKDVRYILSTVEQWQRTKRRRLPQNINVRFNSKKPGILSADLFFTSKLNGWSKKMGILVIMDTWSRY